MSIALSFVMFSALGINTASVSATSKPRKVSGCKQSASILKNRGIEAIDMHPQSIHPVVFNTIMTESMVIRDVFRVSAELIFIKEARDPNAYAIYPAEEAILSKYRIPTTKSKDGMVLLGVDLLSEEMNSFYRTGYGIPPILAHEYGHIMQYKHELAHSDKFAELHADYMAGWYTAHRFRYVPQNIDESLMSFYSKGNYGFNSAHGTPEERVTTFLAGVALNLYYHVSSSKAAYDQGIKYLKANGVK